MTLYQNASDTLWKSYRGTRNDFVIIHDLLSGLPGGKILDIGCHSGLFLEGLSEKFDKYGIEPSDTASRAALSRGVRILGKTLTQINPDQRFDVVVAIDVIEHVTDVTEFLCNTLRHVKEEGLLIISTGNPDCTLWKKIFKARFWYNSLSEHLTFPSIAYFTLYCEQAGLARPLQICFCYLKCSLGWKFVLCASQIIFFISPLMYRFFEYRLRKTIGMPDRVTHDRGLAAGGSFKDHQLIVIKK